MTEFFHWFFAQYSGTPTYNIVLEIIAVIFGLLSPWYSMKDNILVYPTGIISTLIYVYLFAIDSLYGDMIINAYYLIMSVYGWYFWTRKIDEEHYTPITTTSKKEWGIATLIFIASGIFVALVYWFFDRFNVWWAYTDTFTTGLFFMGMWLMAKKKIENWTIWIIGDIICVPLYFYKGLAFTSFLNVVMTIIAIKGYIEWKKTLNKEAQTV